VVAPRAAHDGEGGKGSGEALSDRELLAELVKAVTALVERLPVPPTEVEHR
jgi:hypothetical protein